MAHIGMTFLRSISVETLREQHIYFPEEAVSPDEDPEKRFGITITTPVGYETVLFMEFFWGWRVAACLGMFFGQHSTMEGEVWQFTVTGQRKYAVRMYDRNGREKDAYYEPQESDSGESSSSGIGFGDLPDDPNEEDSDSNDEKCLFYSDGLCSESDPDEDEDDDDDEDHQEDEDEDENDDDREEDEDEPKRKKARKDDSPSDDED